MRTANYIQITTIVNPWSRAFPVKPYADATIFRAIFRQWHVGNALIFVKYAGFLFPVNR